MQPLNTLRHLVRFGPSSTRFLILLLTLLLVECGGGGGGGDAPNNSAPYNPLWVTISNTSGNVSTTSIDLTGYAYCDNCKPPPDTYQGGCPNYSDRGSNFGLVWRNKTTGVEGGVSHVIHGTCYCYTYFVLTCSVYYDHQWSATGIPLTTGNNIIEVKAYDGSGNSATDSVTITNQFGVQSTSPSNNATSIPTNTAISAMLNGQIDPQSVTSSSFIVSESRGVLTGNYKMNGSTVTFTPDNYLYGNTTYTATITSDVKDINGIAARSYTWKFTTVSAPDSTPPTVVSTIPTNNATGLGTNIAITATFSEPMDASTVNAATFTLNNGVTGTVTYNGKTAKFTPTGYLASSTTYTATITTGVKDAASNAMFAPYSWTFTTGAVPDSTTPTVVSTIPTNNATGVGTNIAISATFSEPMDALTVNAATFTLNNGVTGTVTYSGNTATFMPSGNLLNSIMYIATITTGVKDAASNAMAAPYTWSFSTVTTGASFKMPDTGQTTSYTATFGEDNDYAINPPSYTDNGNGTITDNITSLVWQKQDDAVPRTWDNAVAYCSSLTFAGRSDWRLPSRIDLISIVDYGVSNPAINTTYFPGTTIGNYWSSTEAVGPTDSWGIPVDAWGVSFSDGSSEYNVKNTYIPYIGLIGNYVRCVRGG